MQKQEKGELSQETKVFERIREKLELPNRENESEEEKVKEEVSQGKNENNADVAKEEKNEETHKEKEKKQEEKNKIMEQKKDKQKLDNKTKKKWVKPVIVLSIIFALFLIFSTIFAIINMNSNKIISGITINDIEVSGLTKDEAKGKLETIINEKKKKEITLKYNDFSTEINPELIEVNYELDKAIDNAFNIGRDGNIFTNNYNILFTLLGKKNINIDVSINNEILEKNLKTAGANIPGAVIEASYYIEEDKLIITKGNKGITINYEDAKNKIEEALKDINSNNKNFIDLIVTEKEPDAINIEKIYEEVHKEAKDAYYTKEPFQIFPEVDGVDFNLEEAKNQLAEDKEEYTIKLTISKPNVTVDQIGTEAFPDRLAIFTTKYNAADTNRTTNLRIACEKINGKVLMPGETFSYNKALGQRTAAAGYKNAAVYENGQVVDGIGGGICQISSTLYNVVLMSNLEIIERSNHQFVTSYLPAGRDATVVYGAIDFRFKNTRSCPIKINAGISGGVATVSIFGVKDENDCTVTFETKTLATLPVTVKYVDDSTLAPGEEVVKQSGHTGVQTETYIIKSKDGKVVSKSLLSKDTYSAMQKIIRRGVTSTPAPAPTPTPTEQAPAVQPAQTTTPEATPTEQKNNSESKKESSPKKETEQKDKVNSQNTTTNTDKGKNNNKI